MKPKPEIIILDDGSGEVSIIHAECKKPIRGIEFLTLHANSDGTQLSLSVCASYVAVGPIAPSRTTIDIPSAVAEVLASMGVDPDDFRGRLLKTIVAKGH